MPYISIMENTHSCAFCKFYSLSIFDLHIIRCIVGNLFSPITFTPFLFQVWEPAILKVHFDFSLTSMRACCHHHLLGIESHRFKMLKTSTRSEPCCSTNNTWPLFMTAVLLPRRPKVRVNIQWLSPNWYSMGGTAGLASHTTISAQPRRYLNLSTESRELPLRG